MTVPTSIRECQVDNTRLSPPQNAGRLWAAFLRNQREIIAAMDFFTVPTLTFRVLYCFMTGGCRYNKARGAVTAPLPAPETSATFHL